MKYLLKQTEAFFKKKIVSGGTIWTDLINDADFVLACPNAWGPKQHHTLRQAALLAGLSNDDNSSTRIHFVSEAEAAVHFCLTRDHVRVALKVCTWAICYLYLSLINIRH